MRFLVDECTGPGLAKWLLEQSHDVVSVYDESPGVSDDEVLAKALAENRLLITNDKDFGEKVFRDNCQHHGIIFLRLQDERTAAKIDAIHKLLDAYKDQLPDAFVVVTETQVRFGQI